MHHILITIWSAVLVVSAAAPAAASGSQFEPDGEGVEAGEQLELSGEASRVELGWTEEGPFFAYPVAEDYGTVIPEGFGGAETDVPRELDETDGETTVSNPGTSTTTDGTVVMVVETTAPVAVSTAGIHLMLAPHPARSNNLAPAWIAVSAGLAAVVLLLILFTRQSDTPVDRW